MKGQFTDAATGLPLAGVKWLSTKITKEDGTPTTGSQITTTKRKASKHGRWQYRKADPGGYSFAVILPGYIAPPTNAYVITGQTTVGNIKLNKKTT